VRNEPVAPHPTAQRVIELLAASKCPEGLGIAAMRRHYNLSRRQFLSEMEPVENIIHICPAQRGVPRLTIIRPRGFRSGDRLPALVYMHGGGWSLGSLATYEPFCRQLANACNMIIVWVEYRLAPEYPFPAAYEDTLAAWRWVTANSWEVGADLSRISAPISPASAWGATAPVAISLPPRAWHCDTKTVCSRGAKFYCILVWT
jgi:acetyl esterase